MAHDSMDTRGRPHAPRTAPDRWLALGVFVALAATYVFTLLPGLGGTEDTPKFQYVGPALGTPHDPGYPLYMIVSWAFSKLPVGTLAYRINLLSAVWGAAAGAFAFLAMRRLAVPRVIAASTALALGLGRFFWQHATFAEAYTQASALTAAALLALLIWDDEGRERWLYAAVAAISLAFGTHLIVVGMVPVFAWFVLDRYRWRVPLRVLGTAAVIVALGVAQYGYVWVRTVQGARYLEARATSAADLLGSMRGRQFDNQTFKEPLPVLLQKRGPEVAAAARAELGALAGLAALAGVAALWRGRRRTAALLTLAFLGPAVLLAALGSVATTGIQLPSLMPVWVLAGCGFAGAWRGASSLARRAPRAAVQAAVSVAIVAAPVAQGMQNFDAANSRNDTYESDYFSALFQLLGDRTAFVDEHYSVNHFVEYTRYTTGQPGVVTQVPRDPAMLAWLLDDGYEIYCFPEGFDALAGQVRSRTVRLLAPSLDARLAQQPPGLIVVVAGYAERWPELRALGLGRRAPRTGRAAVVALNGIGPVAVLGEGGPDVLELRAGDPLGDSGQSLPVSIRVQLDHQQASIAVDGQVVVQAHSGLAVAEIGTTLQDHYTLEPGRGYRPELNMSRRPLHRITGVTAQQACTPLGHGSWAQLADPGSEGVLVGRVDNYRAFDSTWVVYLDSARPLEAALDGWSGAGTPELTVGAFDPRRDGDRLRQQLASDGVSDTAPLLSSPALMRLAVSVNDGGDSSTFTIRLGGLPARGWGRAATDRPAPDRASACAGATEPLVPAADTQQAAVYLGTSGSRVFADNWHGAEPAPGGYFRRTGGREARLLLPIERPATVTLRLSVEPLGEARSISASLNGHALGEQPLTAGAWNEIAWPAAAPLWRAGVNELALQVGDAADTGSPSPGTPSLRVRSLVLDWSGVK